MVARLASAGETELLQEKLMQATEIGDAKTVEEILLEGASPNYAPPSFRKGRCSGAKAFETWSPPLLLAANHGHVDVVRLLLHYGADMDGQFTLCSREGIQKEGTALMAALINAHEEIVSILLENGADTEIADDMFGTTAILALAGATRQLAGSNDAMTKADLGNLSRLLDANADLDKQDELGRTALWLAASSGNVRMVEALLLAGADTTLEADCTSETNRALYEETCTAQRIAEIRGKDKDGVAALFTQAASR
jgi:ankyrin repeat protein